MLLLPLKLGENYEKPYSHKDCVDIGTGYKQ